MSRWSKLLVKSGRKPRQLGQNMGDPLAPWKTKANGGIDTWDKKCGPPTSSLTRGSTRYSILHNNLNLKHRVNIFLFFFKIPIYMLPSLATRTVTGLG